MSDNAIVVKNASKDFRLPQDKAGSLKTTFTRLFKKRNRTITTQHALRDISFEVKKGEFFGIVGRNGSGKSTILKMLAGIYQPTKGSVRVEGKLVPFIELGVGFNPELTGRQNVYLNGALLGFSEKEVREQYDDIVSFAELEDFMDQKLKNYSSGMQVRLAFSMAVRAKAEVLLIDEVLAVGDADFQRKCFNYFDHLRKEKTTVVFVSHNMDAVREYCDRAMLVEKNEIITIGSTDEVASQYLRLFMQSGTDVDNNSGEQNRWGDKAIKVMSVKAEVDEKQILIKEVIKANQDIGPPIAGFRIRDATGAAITGTNTKVEKIVLPNMDSGQQLLITWTIPNILRDGRYSIDPAILHPDAITVADWWDDAEYFVIKKSRHLPYTIDPGFDVKIQAYKK